MSGDGRGRRRLSWLLPAIGMAAVLLGVVALFWGRSDGTDGDDRIRILIVGDSIASQARAAFERGADPTVTLSFNVERGVMHRELVDTTRAALVADPPQVVIIVLGTNDVLCALRNERETGCHRDEPEYATGDIAGDVHDFYALLVDVPCVVGVTALADADHIVSDVLDELVADGDVEGVADWRDHLTVDLGSVDEYLTDLVGHLTPSGAEAFADYVWGRTARICGLGG